MTRMTAPSVVGPINIGGPSEFAIRELAELGVVLTGSGSKLAFRPSPANDPKRRRPDISRAEAELGRRPMTPLGEGLDKTIGDFDALLRRCDEPFDIGARRAALNGG